MWLGLLYRKLDRGRVPSIGRSQLEANGQETIYSKIETWKEYFQPLQLCPARPQAYRPNYSASMIFNIDSKPHHNKSLVVS